MAEATQDSEDERSRDRSADRDLGKDRFDEEWFRTTWDRYLAVNLTTNEEGVWNRVEGNVLEEEQQRNWDIFYQRHQDNFFKDRHYLLQVFPKLNQQLTGNESEQIYVLEVGCGVANTAFPLLQRFQQLHIYALDFSETAIKIITDKEHGDETVRYRIHPRVCDVTNDASLFALLQRENLQEKFDFVTLIFLLSALAPKDMKRVVLHLKKFLKEGGCVLFRDYAVLDVAQLRFHPSQRLGFNHYVREDKTTSFFFSKLGLISLFTNCGFSTVSCDYSYRYIENRKEQKQMCRVFLTACFQKRSRSSETV